MDTFLAFVRRLTLLVAVLTLGILPRLSHATDTYSQAKSKCQTAIAVNYPNGNSGGWSTVCKNSSDTTQPVGQQYWFQAWQQYGTNPGQWLGGRYYFDGVIPSSNPCTSLASATVNVRFTSQASLGNTGATWATDPVSGLQVQCPYTISYSNYSALADSQGFFHVTATLNYTGNPSGSESSTPTAGTSVYDDASGNPLNPQPVSDGSTSPQLCGGTSCADPSTGNVCAMVGGSQVCQRFPAWTPNMAGGCSGGSAGAICAGSPNAPSPQPGQGGVTDPATQIAGSDHYTSKNMTTGQVSTVVVNTFAGLPGQTVTNGASSTAQPAANSSGSAKPASSSTSAGSSGYGSGGDCNSPPVCSGDAVMCGIARQEWYTMCSAKRGTDQLHQDLVGDGSQSPPAGGTHTGAEVSSPVVDTGDTSGLDSSGLGWGTACPFTDLQITIGNTSASISFQPVCDYGVWMRGFVLLLGALTSAGILGGFRLSLFGGSGGSE